MKSNAKKSILFMLFVNLGFSAKSQSWQVTGNAATSGDFAGTTNTVPFDIKTTNSQHIRMFTYNTERMRIMSSGEVGIGTTAPVGGLDVAIASTYGDIVASRQGAYFAGNWPTAGMWQLGGGDVNGNIFLASSTTGDPTLLSIPKGALEFT